MEEKTKKKKNVPPTVYKTIEYGGRDCEMLKNVIQIVNVQSRLKSIINRMIHKIHTDDITFLKSFLLFIVESFV